MSHDLKEKFVLRLPEGMREKIREQAARECRTMNAEVIYQLRRAYDDTAKTKKADAA